jgi:hypothetical protein
MELRFFGFFGFLSILVQFCEELGSAGQVCNLSTRCMKREQQVIGRRCALMLWREVHHHRGVRSECFEAIDGHADDFFDARVGRADIVVIDLYIKSVNFSGKSF